MNETTPPNNPLTTQIIEMLQTRSVELLKLMQGFKEVQKEYTLTTRALRTLTNGNLSPGRPPGTKKVVNKNKGGGIGPSLVDILATLGRMPHGGKAREIAMQMGRPEEAKHVSVTLPYSAVKKYTNRKEGTYTITTLGREYVASGGAKKR